MRDAIVEGFRYVRGAPEVRSVLIRTGAFSVGATSLLALLPVICQPHGAQGYGFLLTCFGLGAMGGAALLPRLRLRYSVDGLVAGATVVFAAMTFLAGQVHVFEWLCLVLFTAGAAWIGILACFNVVAQTMCPSWMRARALSMYLLVLQGGMAIGSAVWGALAAREGVPAALAWSALAMVVGLTHDPAASVDGGGVEDGSGGGEGLKRGIHEEEMGLVACGLLVLTIAAAGQASKPKEERRSVTQVLDRTVLNMEHEFVPAAEAMPEDKFGFAPTNGEFKGVRTFAQQIKHVAAVNYELGAALLEEKPPVDIGDESGPAIGHVEGRHSEVPERII